ncbi:type-F conjugative transfer system pilin chaperone TraQ [Serratia marcescens]|nr:type-F conjugative transfer system pilin chaperone TraQ [Serratia marcescens]
MRKFKFPQIDVAGMWMVGLGLWCNMIAGCVCSLPDFAWGLAKLLAVSLVIIGSYRILDAIATRVADERMAPEKAAYRAQHGDADSTDATRADEPAQEEPHAPTH